MRRLGVALCLACAWAAPDRIVYPAIPCDRSSNSTDDAPVLLFIHVFKAAGSSVRALLRRYAERCSRRWACLVTCQDGKFAVNRGLLRGQNVPCRLRDTVNVKRDALFPPGARGDGKLRRNPQAALLARCVLRGHYHYGLHNIFQAPTDRRHFYMTVLREPIATWISGMRYNDRSLKTAKSVVAAMTSELAAGKKAYSNAMSYMVESDKQKDARRRLARALENLAHITIVGVVESWRVASKAMARSVLDSTGAAPSMWDHHRKAQFNSAKTKAIYGEDDVIALLRADANLWQRATTYLAFENRLYTAGLRKHAHACNVVMKDKCRLRFGGGLSALLNASLLVPGILPAGGLRQATTVVPTVS
ncbi:hypothetical protein M885DRAFT_451358 [Pelagophyceae sp. CCMP2097]|nr:hypothetical protein M885DRAFT_451358 [Pelagophyceae sp. CCMP2097]